MGTIETDSEASYTFLLYNLGGKHLRIAEVEVTCGCTVADISSKVIAPGGFTRLKLDMDTSLKQGKTKKTVTVHSNDPARPELKLFLEATVVNTKPAPHGEMSMGAKDPLVLFKGDCATCHVAKGQGKSGQQLFLADCAMCHGAQATGHGPAGPSLLNRNFEAEATAAHLRTVIAHGAPHNPQMPPFSEAKGGPLTEGQIDSLVTFLKYQALQKKEGKLDMGDELGMEEEKAYRDAQQNPH